MLQLSRREGRQSGTLKWRMPIDWFSASPLYSTVLYGPLCPPSPREHILHTIRICRLTITRIGLGWTEVMSRFDLDLVIHLARAGGLNSPCDKLVMFDVQKALECLAGKESGDNCPRPSSGKYFLADCSASSHVIKSSRLTYPFVV